MNLSCKFTNYLHLLLLLVFSLSLSLCLSLCLSLPPSLCLSLTHTHTHTHTHSYSALLKNKLQSGFFTHNDAGTTVCQHRVTMMSHSTEAKLWSDTQFIFIFQSPQSPQVHFKAVFPQNQIRHHTLCLVFISLIFHLQ
jgi:hypothetical protein